MEGQYPIYIGSAVCGQVQVRRQGLYWHLFCRLERSGRYILLAATQTHRVRLGLCVPMDGAFGVRCAIPAKRLQGPQLRFEAVPAGERFVPLVPGQPFEALEQLDSARFALRDGRPGLLVGVSRRS